MTEQSQMPLVSPPKRRGWREIAWFRPLTSSTHAALVVTRRGRLVSILPAGGPRVLSDYLAWPYDFREVDTRERLLMLEQRVESFDSSYEFSVALRLIYQVVQPDRVALDLEDAATELSHAVVQSLRLSGRSFGVEQDKTFEEHLQETLLIGDALVQRVLALGLALRRADVTVTLDTATRSHAEALRFAMRERPLHFQIAIESLEPDRRFDVIVGGAYRLIDRRAHDGPSDITDSAIQQAITNALRRVGITFAPGDYLDAAKTMADVLRKDALLQSELSMVQAQLLRPTVQIQPDRSMVHVPRPTMLGTPDTRPDPMLRRTRQSAPRMGRRPALVDSQERAPQPPAPPARRALPPPASPAARWAAPTDQPPADSAASPTLPLGELPAPSDSIEGAYALWPLPASMPMRARPVLGQPDEARDLDAPWADLISKAGGSNDDPWAATLPATASEPVEPRPWDALIGADTQPEEPVPAWFAAPPAIESAPPAIEMPPDQPQPWDGLAAGAAEPQLEVQAPEWAATLPQIENDPVDPLPEEQAFPWFAAPPVTESAAPSGEIPPEQPQPWDALVLDTAVPSLDEQASPWFAAPPVTESAAPSGEIPPEEPQPWDALVLDAVVPPLDEQALAWFAAPPVTESAAPSGEIPPEQPQPWDALVLDAAVPAAESAAPSGEIPLEEPQPWDALVLDAAPPVTEGAAPSGEIPPEQPQPWEHSATADPAPPAASASPAAEEPWSVLDTVAEAEAAADLPIPSKSDPVEDLGFSLDWSEPEVAMPAAELPASASEPAMPADDLGFSLDWSDIQPDSYASAWTPGADTRTENDIITAHWEDPAGVAPAPALFSDLPATDSLAADASADLDSAQPDLEYAQQADQLAAEAQDAEQGEAPAVVAQESSLWYAPTLQLDDTVPLDSSADDSGYVPFETLGTLWSEQPAASDYEPAADAIIAPLPETFETPETAWAEQPAASDYELAADAVIAPPSETFETPETAWAEQPAVPDYEPAADAFTSLPNEDIDERPITISEPVSDSASEPAEASTAPAPEIPGEQIARIIGMIQSYGPAWFKMWSMELKERPERLPVVLGEVTADPVLLAQAADPRVQSALLAALAAYTAPVTFPARLPAAAPLPSPAIVGQGRGDEDEVPDWLSLRVKWNGHGGGA